MMSRSRDEVKVVPGPVKPPPDQPTPPLHQRAKARQNQVGDGNQLTVLNQLRFPDDFSEFVARSEGGGSPLSLASLWGR